MPGPENAVPTSPDSVDRTWLASPRRTFNTCSRGFPDHRSSQDHECKRYARPAGRRCGITAGATRHRPPPAAPCDPYRRLEQACARAWPAGRKREHAKAISGAGLRHRQPGKKTGRSAAVVPPRPDGRSGRRSGRITPCNRYRRAICRFCRFRGPGRSIHEPGFVIIAALGNAPLTCNFPRAAYRNRTDDLRITRGKVSRSRSMTCTDSTADRTRSADCTGISRLPVPRPVPRLSHRPQVATVVSSRTLAWAQPGS
jgi:hypothetical protein